MASRLSIAGVLCLVVVGAGAVYLFRDSLFGVGPSMPVADSGSRAERPPAQVAPPERADSGAAKGAAVSPPAPGAPASDDRISSPGNPNPQAQAVGAEAVSIAPPAPPPVNPEAKSGARTPMTDATKPAAEVAANPTGAPPSPGKASPVAEGPAQVNPPAVSPVDKVESTSTAGGSATGETPPIKVAGSPASNEAPPPVAGPPAASVAGIAPPGETPRASAAAPGGANDKTPAPAVEATPITAMTPPAEPPVGSQASPAVATPAPSSPVAGRAARNDTAPPAPIEATPMAPPAPIGPPLPQSGPVAEGPALAEMQAAPLFATPPAEIAAKDEAPPPPPVEARPIAAAPAGMQSLAAPTGPAAESAAKDETPRVEPPAPEQPGPVVEAPPPTEAPAVSPPAKPAAESLANEDVAAPPAQPAKPNAQTAPPLRANEPVSAVEATPIVIGKPPAPVGAEPAATPKPDAGVSATGSGPGPLAAIVPPRAPQAMLAIEDAVVGEDYAADLPPFSDPNGARGIALRVEPSPPEGLSFVDLGSGFGAISGKPTKPGRFVFDVVASNSGGGAARMAMTIKVAPAPSEPKPGPQPSNSDANPQVAALGPLDKAARFLSGFDGGPCFLARADSAAGGATAIEGVGSQKEVFQRFYESFIRDVGVEPTLAVRLIASPQCPAINLIAAAHADRAAAPTIKLAAYDVARGKPLAGAIGALAGRRLAVLVITNDGLAHKIVSRGLSADQSAPFSVPITPDASSIGALQILVAIVSPKPLDALATFRSGPSADILPKVAAQLGPADAALSVEYFRFLK